MAKPPRTPKLPTAKPAATPPVVPAEPKIKAKPAKAAAPASVPAAVAKKTPGVAKAKPAAAPPAAPSASPIAMAPALKQVPPAKVQPSAAPVLPQPTASDLAKTYADNSPVEPTAATKPEPVVAAKAAPEPSPAETSPPPPQPGIGEVPTAAIPVTQTNTTPYLEGNAIMNEAIETGRRFAEESKDRVQSVMTEFNDKAKSAMEKSSKAMEEFGDITKGNLEAMVETSKIAAKGMEQITQHLAEVSRSSFERTSSTMKNFASVKSPTEFFQLQSELMTSAFDTMASETAKASEAMLKLAGEIAQPLSNRVSVVSDRMKTIAA